MQRLALAAWGQHDQSSKVSGRRQLPGSCCLFEAFYLHPRELGTVSTEKHLKKTAITEPFDAKKSPHQSIWFYFLCFERLATLS